MAKIKCNHCEKRQKVVGTSLCRKCASYPRCESCKVIIGESAAELSKDKKNCTICYDGIEIETKAKRQSCAICGSKKGKIEFHLLIGADKVLPYHAECLKEYEDT